MVTATRTNILSLIDAEDEGAPAPAGTLEALQKLTRDLKGAAATLSSDDVRFFVDMYYAMQRDRIRAMAQIRASGEAGEPNSLISWLFGDFKLIEANIKRAMQAYAESKPEGRWLLSIVGIGPVIAAGLMAHFDVTESPRVSNWWSLAGMNPNQQWLGTDKARALVEEYDGGTRQTHFGYDDVCALALRVNRNALRLWKSAGGATLASTPPDAVAVAAAYAAGTPLAPPPAATVTRKDLVAALAKRPWNAGLKTLCWKAGQSFMKSAGRENAVYGPLYQQRKAYELANNNMVKRRKATASTAEVAEVYEVADVDGRSAYADQAAAILRAKHIGTDTDAYRWYSQGMLPPAQIDARARRWAVKLFLSHFHQVCWQVHQAELPYPAAQYPVHYAIAHLGHVGSIPVPNKEILRAS